MRWFKRILISFFGLLGITSAAAWWLGPNMVLYPRRINWDKTPSEFHLEGNFFTVTTSDSISIKGYWARQSCEKRPVIILVHGIGNCKERWYPGAEWLWQEGFSTVMVDLRAHGESGGNYCTYGYREKNDISAVVSYILEQDSTSTIGIWGHSLGGAVALQTLASDRRLKFGVVESTFADFRQIVGDYQRRYFKLPLTIFTDHAIEEASQKAGFEPDSIVPYRLAERIHQPVFMAHGTEDERISFTYGEKIFAHLGSDQKQFYPVNGAGHNNLSQVGGDNYARAIIQFLKSVTASTQ